MKTPKPTKIIFLDIDGVVIPVTYLLSGNINAAPRCVENLNRLVERTGADIVVSSTWRELGLEKVTAYLREWGVIGNIIDITPFLEGRPRGHEIKAWLDGQQHVSAFVILDDNYDMAELSDYLVLTDYETGLTRADAETAVSILRLQLADGHPLRLR